MTRLQLLQRLTNVQRQLVESLERQIALEQYIQGRPMCARYFTQKQAETNWYYRLLNSIYSYEFQLDRMKGGK